MIVYNVLFKGVEKCVTPFARVIKGFDKAQEYARKSAESRGLTIKSELGFLQGDEFTLGNLTDFRCEDKEGNSYYFVIYVQELDINIETPFTKEETENFFIDFWEGGYSSYWCRVNEPHGAKETFRKIWDEDYTVNVYDGEEGDNLGNITKESLIAAKGIVEENNIDMTAEDYDAVALDELFQYMILGSIVYG